MQAPGAQRTLATAVGDELALRVDGRWEPVTVVDLPAPGRAKVVYDGHFGSSINYYKSYYDTVDVTQLHAREGVQLHWHYRRVLLWVAVLFVGCSSIFLGGWFYLQEQHAPQAESTPHASSPDWSPGDAALISWKGDWYPGVILEARGNEYLVSYDGYGERWNEVVDAARLRAPEKR